jgi:hypothetical protein
MEHDLTWPLYRPLPKEFNFFDVAEVIDFLQDCPPDAPIWLVNYRQVRNFTQRPMDGMGGALAPDGVHVW